MPRRILLLITDLEIGGTPTVVRELATRLNVPPEVVVEVACLSKWGPVADQLKERGVVVHAMNARGPGELLEITQALLRLIRERQYDTVFSFLVHANVVAARAANQLPGVRFLQSIQTIQPKPRWHWWAQRWAHRRADRVVVPSNAIVRFASRRSRIPESKFVVIPNAVDPADFPRVNVFAGPKLCAGFLGRLDEHKNPYALVEQWKLVERQNAELHFFGEGPARNYIEILGIDYLDQTMFLHGAVSRPQDALRQMDVLWQPSYVEGFGLVVIEAMASGVPVVTVGGTGVDDIVENESNAIVAWVMDDEGRFGGSLKRLRDDVTFRNRLIENGLKTVRERFCWDVVLPQYRKLLDL